MSTEAAPLDDLADVSNVLLLGPSVGESVDAGCKRLLTADEGDALLVISFMLSPSK